VRKNSVGDAFSPQGSISKKSYLTIAVISFAVVLAVWALITELGLVNKLFLPKITDTIASGVSMFTSEDFLSDISISIYRVMMGFAISAIVAIPLGLLVGIYAPVEAQIEPIMSFIRYMPASAFIPLFILWIGIGEAEKIAIIIIGSLPQLILMVAVNTRQVSHDLVEVSYTLGTPKSQVLWKVILPGCMPSILDSLRMVLGWAWTYLIVAEMVGASSGIGYMILQSQRMLGVSKIFVGILTIGLLGLIFDMCFRLFDRLLFPWK